MNWTDTLGPDAKELLDADAELREAREAAQQAMKSGDREKMEAALKRLQSANARSKTRLP